MSSRRIVFTLLLLALLVVLAGAATVYWSKGGDGTGLYSRYWSADPVQGYWDPENFYQSTEIVEGVFESKLCIECH
ncbi:MAG: hypothetical protein HOE82_04005, partial [Gammaproteobacteria bacterium]|nr:hypothetical protein [Gammaproteobacteria bacterium]MBT4606830.1 hypothetical protein [Thiotrichales bacterium]MBT7022431.1 hypothetical protein [Gammaproteobacteria bacterium]